MIFIGRYWKPAYCYNMYNLSQSETIKILRYIISLYARERMDREMQSVKRKLSY